MNDIDVIELKNKLDNQEDFLLIDVREPMEYNMYHINGKLIPLGDLPNQLNDLDEYKEKEIVVHCRSGMRSATAKQILMQAGFTNVRNLLGGVLAWQDQWDKM